jgi:oligopeptide/dipeptide ABC transporter ATP-binding protein
MPVRGGADVSAGTTPSPTVGPLLRVDGLTKTYAGRRALGAAVRRQPAPRLVAIDGVSLSVGERETLGLVGESGSGKTTVARCIVRLVEPDAGSIRFRDLDIRAARGADLRHARRHIQVIFQDPYTSLNPRLSVGDAIEEAGRVHGLVSRSAAPDRVATLLGLVGLAPAIARRRPRELSGGQRQRVAIARALAVEPSIIIADEAVSALDVSVQAQIINLFEELIAELGLAVIFISHQLAVIAHLADRVAVMYLGRIVETGPTAEVFARPRHPYTAALLSAHPTLERSERGTPALRGELPSAYQMPTGCRFNTRCPFAEERCLTEEPLLQEVAPGHRVACHVLPDLAGV